MHDVIIQKQKREMYILHKFEIVFIRMYFDVHKSPTYEISYIICILAGYAISYVVITFTSFLMCVTHYIIACFDDLRETLGSLDDDEFVR